MKLKYLSAVAAALALTVSSCDVTDLKPWDSMTDASYWKTTQDLEMYANGLLGNFGGASVSGDATSDLFVQSGTPNSWMFGTYTWSNAGGWDASFWSLIRQCNYFMARYETVKGDQATINKYVGEVRFVRANRYFNIIQNYGDAPWYDKDLQTTDTEALYKPRDPRNFVLGKIIEDLEFAAQWCTESPTSGRPTRDAAKQQLARVCLYYGTYMKYHNEAESNGWSSQKLLQKAADASNELIQSGKYAIVKADNPKDTKTFEGYDLPYANLFVQNDLHGNKEVVMARYYKVPDVTHEVGRQAGGMGFGLSKAFIESFLMADGTPIMAANSGYKGDNTIAEEIEGRDPRLWQIIATSRRPNWTSAGSRPEDQMTSWDYGSTVNPNAGVTGYPCEKFHSSNMAQWNAKSSDFDWFIYRYAEALLINAEANCELGKLNQTILDNTINKLRDRVGMAHLTMSPKADPAALDYGYSVSPILYEIRRERAIELINEGFRWSDLLRWNGMKLLENPKTMLGMRVTDDVRAQFNAWQVVFGGAGIRTMDLNGKTYVAVFDQATMDSPGRKWSKDDKRFLYPIPRTALQLNPALGQNPGWPSAVE